MESTFDLPLELRELLDAGNIEECDQNEYVIRPLHHRTRTWMGWNTVIYTLEIDEDDAGRPLYDIREEIEYLGSDVVLSTNDPDEAAYWITNCISERGEDEG